MHASAMESNAVHIQMPPTGQSGLNKKHPDGTTKTPAGKMTMQQPAPAIDKTLSSAADLVKLLPTGTVLAFQALAPSFTHHGMCRTANWYLTVALIYTCTATCVLHSFTDSLIGLNGKLYYGVATLRGFYPFNFTDADGDWDLVFTDLWRFRIKLLDYVHAFFTAVVFLAVAFGDADIQSCLFSDVGPDLRELLVNLPFGAAFLSSLVFLVFPTTRKGIGYTDMMPHS